MYCCKYFIFGLAILYNSVTAAPVVAAPCLLHGCINGMSSVILLSLLLSLLLKNLFHAGFFFFKHTHGTEAKVWYTQPPTVPKNVFSFWFVFSFSISGTFLAFTKKSSLKLAPRFPLSFSVSCAGCQVCALASALMTSA